MSLDWQIPVAHAVIYDEKERFPAFVHGSGAALDWATAINRAVSEALQMYYGLKAFTDIPENSNRIISTHGNLGYAEYSWTDPLFKIHLLHLIEKSNKKFIYKKKNKTPKDLLRFLKNEKDIPL